MVLVVVCVEPGEQVGRWWRAGRRATVGFEVRRGESTRIKGAILCIAKHSKRNKSITIKACDEGNCGDKHASWTVVFKSMPRVTRVIR